MSPDHVEPELVAYHFGTVDAPERERVEAHLLACGACLRSFMALKRALETQDPQAPRPSDAARARLRRAVQQELLGPAASARRRWERPLAFGLATLTVVLTVLGAQALSAGPGAPPRALSARLGGPAGAAE